MLDCHMGCFLELGTEMKREALRQMQPLRACGPSYRDGLEVAQVAFGRQLQAFAGGVEEVQQHALGL